MRVLVVEDDLRLAPLLTRGLSEEGYLVTVVHNGPDAVSFALAATFDVIVLDVMLPGFDGFQVAKRLRDSGRLTPILMLTARDANEDLIRGLDLGADDYLTKPFAFEVFLARVRAAARRGPALLTPLTPIGDLIMNSSRREVTRAGVPVPLSRTEYSILELLVRRRGHVVPRESIIEEVWGFDREIENNTLDAFMKMLRSKVDPNPDSRRIQTVRGVGYRLRDGDETN
ncbi:MAG: response regulator transcription factor [Acidobacteria bacterium]|nr:response regulator transcription factor [Acidobacteriota bacterium]